MINKIPLFFVMIVILMALLAGHRVVQQWRQESINDASPVRAVQVNVVAKREFPSNKRRSRQREVIAGEWMNYEVTFRAQQGSEEWDFLLPEGVYRHIDQAAQGKLQVQGTRFISFTPLVMP